MIRVIAVDDELPALKRVGQLLESFENIRVCGLFEKPQSLLEHTLTTTEPIDLALLDMEMPGFHGMELARRLRAVRPEIQIAFLTAYEEFARDAFEVEALDYLLKPIMKEDLERTVGRYEKRIRLRGKADHVPESEPGVRIRSFGPFYVTAENGQPIRFRNSKGRELLAYLHTHRGRFVSKVQLMDALWYGRDWERTQANLHSTVYQLRKDLEACGLEDVIEQSKTAGTSYGLRWSVAFDDVNAYEEERRKYKTTVSLTHLIQAVQLYGEGYLAGSGYEWAAPRQAELELGFIELLEAMVDTYVKQQRYEIALSPMQRWSQLLPLSGRLHAKMIALLLFMNREEDARDYHELALEMLDQAEELAMLDYGRIFANPSALF
ncbi:response regulator [Cohnella nanjingensis]|uniref:Response regulator n=1 Tax=Cohnella nanjingensis TaxID=1387779 RepID=A0A7X0VHY8_9BACL|nr:response regulator [Cohnella nanjingensis]MBB6674647.1 response regulator [Cohnella nanjingensis]